jgi:indole-3-glycerol phosphate synthase
MKAEPQGARVLDRILADTARRLAASRADREGWKRRAGEAARAPSMAAALRGPTVGVIAEVKRRSPSAGALSLSESAVELARAYQAGGAAAVSVLTEPDHFGGSLDDLAEVARQVRLPTLRKDFIVDPVQVFEARAAGASAVLLIARILEPARLVELARLAREVGLEVLVEVHRESELHAALLAGPELIGVNARDLDTLAVDPAVVTALLPKVPPDVVAVAESGLASLADLEAVAAAGADAVLVGAALAGADDPAAAVRALLGVGRRGRRA